ncbi:hypothetical protein EUTSA_v10028122mg, partial [Eutrema salsugineum]
MQKQPKLQDLIEEAEQKTSSPKSSTNTKFSDLPESVSTDSRGGLPEDTIQKIVNQVEYYFSDFNLATTDHLMSFIGKDSKGYGKMSAAKSYVSLILKLSLTDSQLSAVLQNSAKLVVSEDGKKVRRINPITASAIDELQSRTIIAENLPKNIRSKNLLKIFSTVGSVKNIRICRTQNSVSGAPPAARSAKNDSMLFSNKVHAFDEYKKVELAEKA